MSRHAKAYIALIFICIVWGTTFLAIRIGVIHYPPFLFAGVRQLIAGLILIPFAFAKNKNIDLSRSNLMRQSLIGFLMLTLGNGCVTWAEKYIPSGIAALLCSMMPIFAVGFNLMSSKKEQLNALIGVGIILGLCGVGLIFRQSIEDIGNPEYLGGMLAVILATASWALGSTLSKKQNNVVNPLMNAAFQLAFGGIFMLLVSPAIDRYDNLTWNTDGILSLVYLIVFGSVLAYAAYMFVLQVLPVGIATIYAYINPLIAVFAGFIFLNEEMNIFIFLAFATIVLSVFLVNKGYRQQSRKNALLVNNTIKTTDSPVPKTVG